jgi:hypothetical protein
MSRVSPVLVFRAAEAINRARDRRRRAPHGKPLVALPQQVYDALIEDARAALEAVAENLRNGGSE